MADSSAPGRPRLRVLIVEDSEPDAELIGYALQTHFDVIQERAWNEPILRAALAAGPWDLVISDYDLPGFSGQRALEVVRATQLDLPFLIVSGQIDQATAVAAMRAGAQDYFFKGDLERLVPAVERELREARERAARRAAEAALQARETLYRRLVEFSPDPTYIQCDGQVVYANPAALAFFGAPTAEALVGRSVWDMVHPESHTAVRANWAALARGEARPLQPQRFVRLDGGVVDVEVAVTQTVFGDRPAVQVTFRDVTKRKRTEDAVLQLNRDLHQRVDELQTLLDLLPVGIVVAYDRASARMTLNAEAAQMLGISPGINPSKTGPQADELPFRVFQRGREVPGDELPMQLAAAQDREIRDVEYEIERADRSRVDLLEYAAPLHDEAGHVRGSVGVFVDITDRKQAELRRQLLADASQALVASLNVETNLKAVCQLVVPQLASVGLGLVWEPPDAARVVCTSSLPKGILPESAVPQRLALAGPVPEQVGLLIDPAPEQLARVLPSPALQRLLAQAEPDALLVAPLAARGHPLGVLVLAQAGGRHFSQADAALAEELARRISVALDNARLFSEIQALNAALEQRVAERTAELQNANRALELQVVEREQAQAELSASREQLRQLAASVEAAREEERTRIAREIHDELAQQLTGLKMDLAWATRRIPPDQAPVREKLAHMARLIDLAIQDVRRITADLRPGLLDDFGLAAVLEWQLDDFESRTGISTHLLVDVDDLPLTSEQTTSLFRIVQEALTNVARHADATSVEVRLEQVPGQLVMIVSDDGRGIDPARPSGARSLGLLGMRERVRALGGVLDLYSHPGPPGTPGAGTTLKVQIPLPSTE